MPRKPSKTSESISALQRRSSRVTLPTAPPTTAVSASASASASPAPSPSTIIPLSVPVANAKNIDDINWRHPAEMQLIHPQASSQADIIPILLGQAISVPPQPTDPNEKFCTITLGLGLDAERVKVVVPLGYRIPLLFCGKYLWESVRLVLTSVDPSPEKEWEQYKFDLLNLSRLCYTFLESALVTMRRKGKGMKKGWRNKMFDRVLTRYFWGWLVNREEYIRLFWFEFKEEEYERDVCRRDWKTMVLTGHKGFYLTPSEIKNGITAEQFTAGLLSLPPQLSSESSPSAGVTFKWDNTLYALANELVITGSRVRERSGSEEGQEGEWEGEEGRRRKRMKIDVDPAEVEQVAFDLVHGAESGNGDGDVEMLDATVVGEVLPTSPPQQVGGDSTTTAQRRSASPQFPTSNMRASTGDESFSAIASALALPALNSELSRSNAASPRPSVAISTSTVSKSLVDSSRADAATAQVADNESTTNSSRVPPTSGLSATAEGPLASTTEKPAPTSSITSLSLALVPATSNSMQLSSSSPTSLPNDFKRSNPEVINQVLNIVPSMLSKLRAIMDVAHSEKKLLSPTTDEAEKQAALEKMQVTTSALSAPSSVSEELMNSLVERIKALESDVQSDRDRRARENLELEQMTRKIGELEERVRGYEALLSMKGGAVVGSNGACYGSNAIPERYRTPLSRSSSTDESCPLPVKSKRKQMNLIAMSESPMLS